MSPSLEGRRWTMTSEGSGAAFAFLPLTSCSVRVTPPVVLVVPVGVLEDEAFVELRTGTALHKDGDALELTVGPELASSSRSCVCAFFKAFDQVSLNLSPQFTPSTNQASLTLSRRKVLTVHLPNSSTRARFRVSEEVRQRPLSPRSDFPLVA